MRLLTLLPLISLALAVPAPAAEAESSASSEPATSPNPLHRRIVPFLCTISPCSFCDDYICDPYCEENYECEECDTCDGCPFPDGCANECPDCPEGPPYPPAGFPFTIEDQEALEDFAFNDYDQGELYDVCPTVCNLSYELCIKYYAFHQDRDFVGFEDEDADSICGNIFCDCVIKEGPFPQGSPEYLECCDS